MGHVHFFAGFLAHLELCLPLFSDDDARRYDCEEVTKAFVENTQNLDPMVFARQLQGFLHHRQGGLSEDLISSLRQSFMSGGSSRSSPSASPTSANAKRRADEFRLEPIANEQGSGTGFQSTAKDSPDSSPSSP
mmetsp:Transcript_15658/g.23279  ORF Transcript_15658/g.23279 Transcript_15658/m.23279 type:complete len:134 (+) Transcript_15658:1-402(+)